MFCAAFPAKSRGVAGAGLQTGLADVADPETAGWFARGVEGGVMLSAAWRQTLMVRRRTAPSTDDATHRRENHEAAPVPFIHRDAATRLLRMRSGGLWMGPTLSLHERREL